MPGMFVNGEWKTEGQLKNTDGRFVRSKTSFRDWISADGSSCFEAEPDRYHLYVAWACPWAHRTAIMRKLKGLEQVIGLSAVGSFMGEDGWAFHDEPGVIPDTVNDAYFLREVYAKADPDYTGRITTPVLWDKQTGTIVNNESREIVRMLDTEFGEFATTDEHFFPEDLRERDRRDDRCHLRAREQRRLPLRFRHHAGGIRRGRYGTLRCSGPLG